MRKMLEETITLTEKNMRDYNKERYERMKEKREAMEKRFKKEMEKQAQVRARNIQSIESSQSSVKLKRFGSIPQIDGQGPIPSRNRADTHDISVESIEILDEPKVFVGANDTRSLSATKQKSVSAHEKPKGVGVLHPYQNNSGVQASFYGSFGKTGGR